MSKGGDELERTARLINEIRQALLDKRLLNLDGDDSTDELDLRAAVLSWWEVHQFDARGDRNLYDEPPLFVRIALDLVRRDDGTR